MSRYWNAHTRALEAYVPGEQPRDKKYIKLNTNENPYPPSPAVLAAMKSAVNEDLRLYPDPVCDELRRTIAAYYHVEKENVFVGNGSDEVLAFSFAAFFEHDKPVLFPDITYSFYPVYAEMFQLSYHTIPLTDDFDVPVEEFLVDNTGCALPNPNAPTGKLIPEKDLLKIVEYNYKTAEKVVIVDEAYIDFGGVSMIPYIAKYPNLLVVQTLSKSRSLAGLRVGFAVGDRELITGLERVRDSINSYTLDRIALAGAVAAFKDVEYFEETRHKVMQTREKVVAAVEALGCTVIPSGSNFIFMSSPAVPGKELYLRLKEKGVLVRYFNKPRIDNYLRVSIGSDEEMAFFLDKLKEVIAGR